MITYKFIATMMMMIGVSLSTFADGTNYRNMATTSLPTAADLSISIKTETNDYEIGQAIFLHVQLTNIGTNSIPMFKGWDAYEFFSYDLERNGKKVQLTKFMRDVLCLWDESDAENPGVVHIKARSGYMGRKFLLQPGEVYDFTVQLNLMFDLTAPDSFRLQVSRPLRKVLAIKTKEDVFYIRSNIINLTLHDIPHTKRFGRVLPSSAPSQRSASAGSP
jgi:hypothetical protein